MRAVFLADAHLHRPNDANYQALLAFLSLQEGRTDLLALLGDICEFLVGGPKALPSHYEPLFQALERLQRRGTRLVYVEGNHDFHLAPYFRDRFPCQLFRDGGSIELDGRHVLLVHGDLANPADRGYRLLRRILRSSPIRLLLQILPPSFIWWIADRSGRASRRTRVNKSQRWPARTVLKNYAEACLQEGNQAVIVGHFHEPFQTNIAGGELIALGDWITQYSYAVWECGRFRLERYIPEGS